jgi:hypothetical protein
MTSPSCSTWRESGRGGPPDQTFNQQCSHSTFKPALAMPDSRASQMSRLSSNRVGSLARSRYSGLKNGHCATPKTIQKRLSPGNLW